jgi:hypothetical protein
VLGVDRGRSRRVVLVRAIHRGGHRRGAMLMRTTGGTGGENPLVAGGTSIVGPPAFPTIPTTATQRRSPALRSRPPGNTAAIHACMASGRRRDAGRGEVFQQQFDLRSAFCASYSSRNKLRLMIGEAEGNRKRLPARTSN